MPARNRKDSTSNRLNISTTLIKHPLSKLEMYKLDDMLAYYRSLTACSNLHLLARTVAEETHVSSVRPTLQLFPEPRITCTICILAQLRCWYHRNPFVIPCSFARPLYAAYDERKALWWRARAPRYFVMLAVVLSCLQGCGCPPNHHAKSQAQQRRPAINITFWSSGFR
jgi:hypothetical protein